MTINRDSPQQGRHASPDAPGPQPIEPDQEPSRIDRWLARLGLRRARRLIIAILGFSTVLIGILMMITPGPALVVIPLGMAILATEFVWARRLMRRVYDTTIFAIGAVGLRDRIEDPLARIAYRMKLISREEMEEQVAEAAAAPRPTPAQRRRLIATAIVILALLIAAIGIGSYLLFDGLFDEQPKQEGPPDA